MDDDGGGSTVLVLLALLVFSVSYLFFAVGRVALARSCSGKLDELKDSGRFGWARGVALLQQAEANLLCCRLAMHVLALLNGALLAGGLYYVRSPGWFLGLGGGLFEFLLGLLVTATLFTFLIQTVAQYLKAIAGREPEQALCRLSYPLSWSLTLLRPLVTVVRLLSKPVLRAGGLPAPVEREMVVSAEEISEIVEMSGEAGELEDEEYEMIQGVFDFRERLTREVMTPRNDVVAVPECASLDEVVKIFVSEGLSRLVVYGSNLDDVRGILMAKDLMPFVGGPVQGVSLSSLLREPLLVPGTRKLGELLNEFRANAVHMAVVLDEHGGLDGVVTVEDILEEIVGDIFDEYDIPEDEMDCTETQSGDLLVDGSTPIDDLNEEYSFDFPEGEYDTIAGFLIHQSGRIPEQGELVQFNGYAMRVEEVVQNRITMVRILRKGNPAAV